jgi:RNA-directed DNA polymerase
MLWLIRRFLKAGIMEDGIFSNNEIGTQQGGNLSPLLANIYLHYVLDLWFEKQFKTINNNYMQLIRYCDDFIVLFASRKDAERFVTELPIRLQKFGLEISPTKTRMLKFSKQEFERCNKLGIKSETFNFLGFTHYFHKSRRGFTLIGHKTNKDNLKRKLSNMKEYLRKVRNIIPLKDWMPIIKLKLTGHYNYFGVSGNMRCLKQYYNQTVSLLFKWLNRRSQRKSMNWDKFMSYLQIFPLPQPRITVNLYTLW